MRRGLAFVAVLALGAIAAPSASAALQGPVYPMPGGLGVGHGGSTCYPLSNVDGAAGKGPGQTWVYGGATGPTSVGGCEYSATPAPPTDFDTSRFDALYWGASAVPLLDIQASGLLALSEEESDYANGLVIWTGTARIVGCNPSACSGGTSQQRPVLIQCKLEIKDQNGDPVALTDASTIPGITNPDAVGAVVAITPSVTRFSANFTFQATHPVGGVGSSTDFVPVLDMFNSYSHPAGINPVTMQFKGDFWFEGRDPTADFTFPTPQNHQPVTFTSTSSDPDGTVASQAWDLDNDGQYDNGTDLTAESTFGPGTHTVGLQVTDDDGEVSTVSHQFTIAAVPPTANFTFPAPQNGVPVTFTSTSTDSDGTVDSQAWDLDNDGAFDDGTNPTASSTYGPGTHTVRLQVTDNDSLTGTVSKSFTIPTPPDKTAPTVTLALTKSKLGKILAKGLKGKLNVNEAARTVLKVTLPKALAKRLKLKGAIGSVTVVHTAAGNKAFTIKLKAKAKRKLKKLRSVKFIVAGTVTDTAGNKKPVKKSLTARR